MLKLTVDKNGYLIASLYRMGKPKQYRVHRLIAEVFIKGKTKDKKIVNHIDNNRKNNRVENLEWATLSENTLHGFMVRTKKKKRVKMKTNIPKGEKEKWLPVPYFEGFYVVSNFGKVKRLETRFLRKDGKLHVTKERFLTPFLYKNACFVVKLTKNGKSKVTYLHRLVAELFLSNPENKPFVRHIDQCIDNNIVFNLKWVDASEMYRDEFESNSEKMNNDVDTSKEVWKDIEKYEGSFQVSNLGRVQSCERIIVDKLGRKTMYKSRVLNARIKGGYYHVNLSKNGKANSFAIHRLVATAFIFNDDPENKIFVNHINANMLDNRMVNLEWVTPKGNAEHMSNLDRGSVKPIQQYDIEGNFIKEYPSAIRAAKENNFVYGTLLAAVANDNHYAYDFLWKWADDKSPLTPYKNAREKRVLRYAMDGKYIQTFESISKAADYMKNNGYPNAKAGNITKACIGTRNYSYDSQWRHEGDETPLKNLRRKIKSVVQLTMDDKYIQTHGCIKDAEIHLGIKLNFSGISKCCNGRQNYAHGFKWMFEEEYKKALK